METKHDGNKHEGLYMCAWESAQLQDSEHGVNNVCKCGGLGR